MPRSKRSWADDMDTSFVPRTVSASSATSWGFTPATVEASSGNMLDSSMVRFRRDEQHWQGRREQLVRNLLNKHAPIKVRGQSQITELEKVGESDIQMGPSVPPMDDEEPYMSWRALVLGALFAGVNAGVNMFFNFRYAGGLSNYWVTVVTYVVLKALENDKMFPVGHWLRPIKFSAREHAMIVLCAAAGGFQQSLGLSSGLATLTIFYGHKFSLFQLFIWTIAAGGFGLFLGMLYAKFLVVRGNLPWPGSQQIAETLLAFHGMVPVNKSQFDEEEDDEAAGDVEPGEEQPQETQDEIRRASLKVYFIFAVAVGGWFLIANIPLQFLVTFPVLCWLCRDRKCQVLGEGQIGVGIPGLSLGPAIVLGTQSIIITLEVLAWISIGTVLWSWVVTPSLYYSGVTRWPGGLNLFDPNGKPWSGAAEEAGFDKPVLSSTTYLTAIGICFTLFGSFIDVIDDYRHLILGAIKGFWNKLRSQNNLPGGGTQPAQDDIAEMFTSVKTLPMWVPFAGIAGLTTTFGLIVWQMDLPVNVGWIILTIIIGSCLTIGLATIMGLCGQNMALPSSMLVQLMFGAILPGNTQANVIISAVNNAVAAQSLSLLQDFRFGLLCGISPLRLFITQLVGTASGIVTAVLAYYTIISWNESGKIKLGSALWPNIGASGTHLLALIFGRFGLGKLFAENPQLKTTAIICFVIGCTFPIIRRRVPARYRPFFPNTVLMGVPAFQPSAGFSVTSGVIVGLLYNVFIKKYFRNWYRRYRMVSSAGATMGVGLGGLVLFMMSFGPPVKPLDLGGPSKDGCFYPEGMPTY